MFSYCTPKRKGNHKVEVEAVTSKDRGRVMFKFNADGFTAGCTPTKKPDLTPPTKKDKERGRRRGELTPSAIAAATAGGSDRPPDTASPPRR